MSQEVSAAVVLTESALELLATGATMNFAGSELFQIDGEEAGLSVRAIYSRGDKLGDRLVLILASPLPEVLPMPLRVHRTAAYQRMISFIQRASKLPVSLPRGWRQFKHDNLNTFFALPEAVGSTARWIAEVNASGTNDIAFWAMTDSGDQKVLQDFVPSSWAHVASRAFWAREHPNALGALDGPVAALAGVDVNLDPAPQALGVTKSRTFRQWLPDLTASQLQFADAPTDRSIRLRGPAGSGKTLTLGIKAVREAIEARGAGKPLRVLFVTHSWALAGEVDALLTTLSDQGPLDEITTLPLLAVAQDVLPPGMVPADLHLIAEDSYGGKLAQLAQIEEVVEEFRSGDWVTYRAKASADFTDRLESTDPERSRGLAWDLLIEFGCVLGADGIFPSVNSEQRYARIHRAPWMMQLDTADDRRAVYALYVLYYESLRARNLLTADQLITDFLNYLESFTWNHRRRLEGYDLIYVDEFHLFNTLERQVLRYLSRDVTSYPRIFMALDPRQSPWATVIGSAEATAVVAADEASEIVETVDIPTVHRSSPQILSLIKHIHHDYANLNLDGDWDYSISEVESLATPGTVPTLFVNDSFADEELAIYNAIAESYPRAHVGAQIALAILDEDRYHQYQSLISNIAASGRYSIIPVTSREDVATLKYHRKGLVVGPAEYLAGLQFDTVLIAGIPGVPISGPNLGVRRRGLLSLLYLAVSRASREVRIFANEDFGGAPEVLERARDAGVLGVVRPSR